MSKVNDFEVAASVIAKIQKRLWHDHGSEALIFRGTAMIYGDQHGINCSIYRKDKNRELFADFDGFRPIHVEHEIVTNAKRLFRHGVGNIQVLTDLQHFGGDTALIDFSRNMMVALFFACKSELQSCGELIACREQNFPPLSDAEYSDTLAGLHIVEPVFTDASKARVIAQSSVFVHAPDGFIDRRYCTCITIAAQEKQPLLQFLSAMHNISDGTIFSDLPGFLDNEENFSTELVHFYKGLAHHKREEFDKAVICYDQSIKSRPGRPSTYFNRGLAKSKLQDYDGAISDYSEVILLQRDHVASFYSRGEAKFKIHNYLGAISDFSIAIHIQPGHAAAFYRRGLAKSANDDHTGAIEDFIEWRHLKPSLVTAGVVREHGPGALADFDNFMQMQPRDAVAFFNRGLVRFEICDYWGAISDFTTAIGLQQDYAAAFFNRGLAKDAVGEHEGARDDYDEASKIDPKFEGAAELNTGMKKFH